MRQVAAPGQQSTNRVGEGNVSWRPSRGHWQAGRRPSRDVNSAPQNCRLAAAFVSSRHRVCLYAIFDYFYVAVSGRVGACECVCVCALCACVCFGAQPMLPHFVGVSVYWFLRRPANCCICCCNGNL